jgi:hypothetical protein
LFQRHESQCQLSQFQLSQFFYFLTVVPAAPVALGSYACRRLLLGALLYQINMKYYMKNWDNWRWDS